MVHLLNIFSVLLLGSTAVTAATISPNFSCGKKNGYTCPDGYCCSQYGWWYVFPGITSFPWMGLHELTWAVATTLHTAAWNPDANSNTVAVKASPSLRRTRSQARTERAVARTGSAAADTSTETAVRSMAGAALAQSTAASAANRVMAPAMIPTRNPQSRPLRSLRPSRCLRSGSRP